MIAPIHQKILLIDDDPLFGGVMARKARARGLTLDYSSSLVDALYENYLEGYDVAIVDCCMPELNGFEVAQYLTQFLDGVAVVLVSQAQTQFKQYLENNKGASAFVSKGQGTEAILAAAEHLLRRKAQTVTRQ